MSLSYYKRSCPGCDKELSYKSPVSFKFARQNEQKCKDCCERKNRISPELVQQILDLNSQGILNREIARTLGIHHRSVGNYLKEHGREQNFANQPIDMVSDNEAKCRKCDGVKNVDEFQFGRKGQKYQYKFSYCNECRKKQNYLSLNSDVNRFLADRFNRMKRRAKRDDIPFSITKESFIAQYHIQNGLCFYTDAQLVCEVGSELHRDSLSIDKIVPDRGYVEGNVVFTTHRINTCKCDLSLEEIQRWMPDWFYRIKIKELLTIIPSEVDVKLSWNDSTLTNLSKKSKGGFSPCTIWVPTFDWIETAGGFRQGKRLNGRDIFFTLAHEFGHYQSYLSGNWSLELINLRAVDDTAYVEEENRAWRCALETLMSDFPGSFDIVEFVAFWDDSMKKISL